MTLAIHAVKVAVCHATFGKDTIVANVDAHTATETRAIEEYSRSDVDFCVLVVCEGSNRHPNGHVVAKNYGARTVNDELSEHTKVPTRPETPAGRGDDNRVPTPAR